MNRSFLGLVFKLRMEKRRERNSFHQKGLFVGVSLRLDFVGNETQLFVVPCNLVGIQNSSVKKFVVLTPSTKRFAVSAYLALGSNQNIMTFSTILNFTYPFFCLLFSVPFSITFFQMWVLCLEIWVLSSFFFLLDLALTILA